MPRINDSSSSAKPKEQTPPPIDLDDDLDDVVLGERGEEACSGDECEVCQ